VKILLDTNVLIAAFVARGRCADLLEHCIERHDLFTSEFILDEFAEKLVGKFKAEPGLAKEATQLLRSRLTVVSLRRLRSRFAATQMTTTSWRRLPRQSATA
jgi:predicted nucleic acid-binding protein